MIRVTIWNENVHDKEDFIKAIYPNGLHGRLKEIIEELEDVQIRIATLDQPECGLTDDVLDNTDVMLWWGHMAHNEVPDETARKVRDRVLQGMGFIGLHSAHDSKPFKLLMGTSCSLSWRESDFERMWTILPGHPIAKGIPDYFELNTEEMYGERFDIPQPDELVFAGWFSGGELMRSGCCWNRGAGKVFYFQPGHESFKSFYNQNVEKIIRNAVLLAAPKCPPQSLCCRPIEKPMKNN